MEKLLFTGGTGFLGKNVMPLLKTQYDVTTCGITPDDMIKVNLAKEVPALNEHYDVVLHACGKAHMTALRQNVLRTLSRSSARVWERPHSNNAS